MPPRADLARLLGPLLGQRIQLGHVVADLDAALAFWTGTLGVGPFVVIDDPVGDAPFVHRGQASGMRMKVAFSHLGDSMVELICQTNDAPSPYVAGASSRTQMLRKLIGSLGSR